MLHHCWIRPIINGTGNYYIETQTREQKRTDIIVDYLGEQYIIEMITIRNKMILTFKK